MEAMNRILHVSLDGLPRNSEIEPDLVDRIASFPGHGGAKRILVEHGNSLLRESPNCTAFAERFVRAIKSECLDRMIFFGAGSLRHALSEYAAHHNAERAHQGIGNRLIVSVT